MERHLRVETYLDTGLNLEEIKGREGGRERERERGREGGREGGRSNIHVQ